MAPIGPGYATPLDAMRSGPREELLYVISIQPNPGEGKSDLLATVDVNPKSPTYCQIIHMLKTGNQNDELHHSGWNVCSSCYHVAEGCVAPVRDKLVMPALGSDRVYIVDTGKNPRAPVMHKVIDASEMHEFNCATPHTTHCLPTGEIMISTMGDVNGNARGNFILIDGKTYKTKGTWIKGKEAKFNYDYWYQPYFDVMISSEWGVPKVFKKGFQLADAVDPEVYGRSLNVFSWKKRELLQTINLGDDGIAPLEVRFLHDPKKPIGFVGCGVNATLFRFFPKDGKWAVAKAFSIPAKKVTGWIEDKMRGLVTDILLSLDDKYLYLSNWTHGDIRQYDISNPENPKLVSQVFLGGLIQTDSSIKVIEDEELTKQPEPVFVKGRRIYGAPQMLQLSLDGKRLYSVITLGQAILSRVCQNRQLLTLLSPWDKQFYPECVKTGSFLLKLDVDVINGGMTLDKDFYVDFTNTPEGPLLAHEMRYPGGDCTSDIWLAD
ncbi:56kDa selenium binding protein (SBP56) [Popillia japonica]|uniref:56kDa selenium binding protein (SBP56) n=1 Tax=Popillia japonica TaxID=7064 RepID=A0AAW1IG46_POPJA